MKILFLDEPLIFKCVSREDIIESDILVLTLRNEMTNFEFTPEITFTIPELLEVTILTQPTDFKIQNKYEITLKNGTEIIYKGKTLILKTGTDVQNYEYKTQNDEYFRFK
jgi:thioredoxin reductase